MAQNCRKAPDAAHANKAVVLAHARWEVTEQYYVPFTDCEDKRHAEIRSVQGGGMPAAGMAACPAEDGEAVLL